MEITRETGSYNERRMGKPWIAKVDFSNAKGEFSFGDWAGDSRNGGAGVLSINAEQGDIIAVGQKDNRQPRNSSPDFYVVRFDGSLLSLGDKGAAYKHFQNEKKESKKIDREALLEEKKNLEARLFLIDTLLKEAK